MLQKTHVKHTHQTHTHTKSTPSCQGVVKAQQKQKQQKPLLHLWGQSVAIAPILPLVCGLGWVFI